MNNIHNINLNIQLIRKSMLISHTEGTQHEQSEFIFISFCNPVVCLFVFNNIMYRGSLR